MTSYETLNEALIGCVKNCGGSKQVGPLLWPEKSPESAQRLLLDCLNEERAAKLSPEQVLPTLQAVANWLEVTGQGRAKT